MKKATNIEEIYDVFAPEKFLKKDDIAFYVDLYGDKFKEFVTALKYNKVPSKTFFIAGQSGNGKSTVLNLLTTNFSELEAKYSFNHIAGRTIFLYKDIDIVDILLMIGNTLTKNNPTLQSTYFDKLKTIEDVKDGSLEESSLTSSSSIEGLGAKVNIGVGAKFLAILKASVDFEASYRINEEIRDDARRFFKIKRKELIDLTNDIILDYKALKNDNKDLIIVIDDLEKKDNIDELFLEDMTLLNELNIIKVITMPIHLYRNETFPNADVREFGLKLRTASGVDNQEDKKLLEEVIIKRLEDKSLITQEAIKLAIENSGANLRQLIRLIHISAEKSLSVDGNKIDTKEIEDAISQMQLSYSSKVMNMRTFLNEIKATKSCTNTQENLSYIAKATKMELIFAYFNGNTWFELNPVCKNSLEFYNKMAIKNENSAN